MRTPVSAEVHNRQVEITPEKIRLVKEVAPPGKANARVAGAAACMEWGAFAGAAVARADAAMEELGLPADANPYWHYDLDWIVTVPNMDPRIMSFQTIKEDAEEVTQDVLFKVHRKVAAFRGDAALSSWVYRITFNAAMSRMRRASSRLSARPGSRKSIPDSRPTASRFFRVFP